MSVAVDTPTVERTRRALHAVAEHVLAGPEYRISKRIALRVVPGGFATLLPPNLRVEGATLVGGDQRLPISGASPAELAHAVGVDGGPPGIYRDGSGVELDELLDADAAAAAWIAECYRLGDAGLRALAPGEEPVLWPEHFDVGITVGEVNYGVSPGDGHHADPYAYVGPHQRRAGGFWNAPFGAVRSMRSLTSPDQMLAFFIEGRAAAAADPIAEGAS